MSSKILGIWDRTNNFDPSDLEIGHIFPIILSHIPNALKHCRCNIMDVDLGASGSYLHHTLLSGGMDAVLPSTQWHGFALYSSRDESGSFSADDHDTVLSSSNTWSSMSASHGMDCDSSQSSVDSDYSNDTMDKFMTSFISKRIAATAQYSLFLFDMPTEVEEFHNKGTLITQNRRERRSNHF